MTKLLILESPGKVKKVQSFLGSEWHVAASIGHVRDLPQKDIGVSAPDFRPTYQPTERGADVIKRLAAAAQKADAVYLATDPDREGEAIAWHVADALGLKHPQRVTYQEITEKAVKAGIAAPRPLDMDLVRAQEGRRVVDRLTGYMVSGPLSNASGQKLSAGRVQSPAVRLVVEREREIKAFQATTHFGASLAFAGGWTAEWTPTLPDGELYIKDKGQAEAAAAVRVVTVGDCKESESRSAPPAPFTTSTLQQAASNALKLTPKQTMQIAQRLYEAGAITYMRTDSPNLSQEFVTEARAYCQSQGWPLVEQPRTYKAKADAQEAHEAIRPVHPEQEEAGETPDEQALYKLIRLRSLAAMLADAVFAVRTLTLEGDGHSYEAKGRTLTAPGWRVIQQADDADESDTAEPSNPVPAMQAGTQATAESGEVQVRQTRPPSRYTEASLVRELEKRGIGRPSTYASIIDTIQGREYVRTEKRQLVPTPIGEAVVDGLCGKFSFAEYDYTRRMEEQLDAIAEGKADYRVVMAEAHSQLEAELQAFAATGKICPKCGKPMSRRTGTSKAGKAYDFWGCTGFRDGCQHTENPDGTTGRAAQADDPDAPKCPDCGKPMRRRTSATGAFYGCSGYPDCKRTVAINGPGGKPPMKKGKQARAS